MKSIFLLSLLVLGSCGKIGNLEKTQVKQESLSLGAIQSTGLNLGSVSDSSARYAVVICSNSTNATNSQRLSQLVALQNSFSSESFQNFTIAGVVMTPAQMNILLSGAISMLQRNSFIAQCPSQYLSAVRVQ